MSAVLWEWWEFNLDDLRRATLMALPDSEVPDDVAQALWQTSPPVILHAQHAPTSPTHYVWVLDADVAAFIAERDDERRDPQAFR